ncbi:uncharacterized protein LOC120009784 [Tripterygium wilfordii]|uniref:uncharacterized protein LOC120009784 n=1 Tax=Tripterygium wilfordii TaxID=458696 RepID=UPI0018F84814|nr:uncharacterized protein LOC120009784 [Tripterygium wilfordii]
MEKLDEVQIHPDFPYHKVLIGVQLPAHLRERMIQFLSRHYDWFAWSHADMIGIDPEKRRKFAPKRNIVINVEVQKLLDNGSVVEVQYPDWLANVVVLKKKNGKWRVYIDFTDLNKACQKDPFPLPHIDMMVDATAGHELLSFMDAFSGYNQILMHLEDQEKMAFITERGIYCYKVMPIGLKNAGATYQRLVNKMFSKYLGDTMEVYIDDMLVKSLDIQRLNGRVAALSRFISRSSNKCCHFFSTLRKSVNYKWTPECEDALNQLKAYLTSPLLLSNPKLGEQLYTYLAISEVAPEANEELLCMVEQAPKVWTLYVDGSSNVRGSGLGIVLISPKGSVIQQVVRCGFHATNNEAECEALIIGLMLAKELGVTSLKVHSDSQLIVNQSLGSYQAKDPTMTCYLEPVKELQLAFVEFSITQIPRAENSYADALANLGSSIQTTQRQTIPLVHLKWPSIKNQKGSEEQNNSEVFLVSLDQTWMTPFIQYLVDGILPAEKNESRRLVAKAARYTVYDRQFARRSYSGPLLRCVDPVQAQYVLAELHEEECYNHSSGSSLTHRALTTGYYWPTMRSDVVDYVQRCDKCQRFAQIPHMSPERLTPNVAPWPFMKWRMDIVGPLPKALSHRQYFLVTKWIEVEAYSLIKDVDVKRFVWKNIICRFGVPKEIVKDNGPQFATQEFCANWGIRVNFATPRHPQCNGQAEASNKTLIKTMEKRLEKAKGAWADELPRVLWSYKTTSRKPTNETPFSLAYGSETVIPVEAGLPSLDTIDELRDRALTRTVAYHDKVSRYFNKNVRTRTFKEGDRVLRKVFEITRELNAGKLGPNWEGSYLIDRVLGNGTYKLRKESGEVILHPWNAIHLKLYHS